MVRIHSPNGRCGCASDGSGRSSISASGYAAESGAEDRLLEGIRRALLLDLVVQPLLELLGAQNGDEGAHPIVAQPAKLRAGDLILEVRIPGPRSHLRCCDGRDEPDRDREPGDRVLLHAHVRHVEAVDDVLAPELHYYGTVH